MHESRFPQIRWALRYGPWLPLFVLIALAFGPAGFAVDPAAAEEAEPHSFAQPDTWVAGESTWYVATQGDDTNGNGSQSNPFSTIQRAIDTARDGDTVVVLEGRYTGPGNTNLDFLGKAIIVQSRNPDDEACRRATLLDAEGHGTLVRFVHDEGPDSVLAGFTLLAGDTSLPVRGVPGFFEFSPGARPTTHRLAVTGNGRPKAERETGPAVVQLPSGERLWDGNDPFHQPFATTDYNGSGDANRDGSLTAADVTLAQRMADGQAEPYAAADVNGDGTVSLDDVNQIQSAVGGALLPGWWDSLTDRTERSNWVRKALALDPTDVRPYVSGFVCGHFAAQTFLHATGCPADLFSSQYDGGRAWFNIPLYVVTVYQPGFGHRINAVLVGEDPLNMDDWLFIEPQTDASVSPGNWSLPYGSEVEIGPVDLGHEGYGWFTTKVFFTVDASGWTLEEYAPDLILARPEPPNRTVDNRQDFWNPRIVPLGVGSLLYDRLREGLVRLTDVHLTGLPFVDPPADVPLGISSSYARILDLYTGADGSVHLLWKGNAEYRPGVFYGQLDLDGRIVTGVTRISTEPHVVRLGRLVATSDGELHAFWFEHDLAAGIFWSRKTQAGWSIPRNLSPGINVSSQAQHFPSWVNRDLLRYFFDVTPAGDGKIWLAWSEQVPDPGDSEIHERIYDGAWGAETVVEAGNSRGVDLFTDAAGSAHLLSWHGLPQAGSEGRGELRHRVHEGSSWSTPELLDDSGTACCPWTVANADGGVYAVWERREGDQVVPLWSRYAQGTWDPSRALAVRPGADAWYPTAAFLPNGKLVFAWSSRSPDRATVETATIALYGLLLSTPTAEQPGLAGEVVTYTLHLTNTGALSDIFDVVVGGNSWPTVVSPSTVVPLPAGVDASIEVTVTVPTGATAGNRDTAIVTIISRGDRSQSATANLNTTVPVVHGLALAPTSAEGAGLPGALIAYTLQLSNTGTLSDTFEVTIRGHSWTTSAPSPVGPLAPRAGTELPVTVRIPTEAADGAADTAILTLTSLGDPQQSAGATLTTTARSWRIHLPLVLKGSALP